MMTLRLFSSGLESVPAVTTWYLADLGEALGKQELFTKQSPQKLRILCEHALIESTISSNRIEGVLVDKSRVGTIVFGTRVLRDRDEEEVRGYRKALALIHEGWAKLPIAEATVLQLHRLSRANVGDAGQYKERDGDIIEKLPDGRSRVRFKTVPADQTPAFMMELVDSWGQTIQNRPVHPLIAIAAMNLDFLCIHPFRDGNGRVSRLTLLLACYHLGYEVGRYISLERLIEDNKDRYYETLEMSSSGWHEGKHDPWPYINYVLFILKAAYREFEERVGQVTSPRGAKTELVTAAVQRAAPTFRVADIQRECPGVSLDLIRQVLKGMQAGGLVECLGRGRDAQWRKNEM